MQQLALVTMISQEQADAAELEWQRFRSAIIATHPGEAKKILDALDGQPEEDTFAQQLEDEELEDYERLSHEEVEAAIDDLRRFGISVG